MFKFVHKNKKLIGVVMGVILMIMFLSNLAPQQSSQPSALLRVVAKVDGQKVTLREISSAADEWQVLKTLAYYDPNRPNSQAAPLVNFIFGEDLAQQLDQAQKGSQSVPMFFLLLREAEKEGIVVSPEYLESFVTSYVFPHGDPGTEERERVDTVVLHALQVQQLLQGTASVIKISRPYEQYQLARSFQELTVNIVPIFSASFQSHVPEPTDAQVRAQFDQFKDVVAARPGQIPSEFGKTSDPLGFGYKSPNRIQLQYIGLNFNDVRQAAIASKSQQDWYVAAFGAFQANREDYDGRPIPSTNPSTQPSGESAKKVDDLKADFALHVGLVLEDLYNRQAHDTLASIVREITSKMSSGYGSYRDGIASGAKENEGSAGQYTNFKFMQDLADSVHAKFGVTPVLGNIQQFKSIDQLQLLEGIGQSVVPTEATQGIPFPIYAIRFYQPWISETDKNSRQGALALNPWQPSNPLIQPRDQSVYVFRISGSEAEHVPTLADVKTQVIADWKAAGAYNLALEAGKKLLADSRKIGLEKAAVAANLPTPILTDPFDPQAIVMGRANPVISPLRFSADSARELAKDSQQLLITPASANSKPQLMAQLYADRIVSVIELHSAEPIWNDETKSEYSAYIAREMQMERAQPLALSLFTADALKSRMNYESLEKQNQ